MLTRHHLVPRARHGKPRTRKLHPKREQREQTVGLCRPCHSQVHAVLSERELAEQYNTIDKLAAHPEVAKFAAWIGTKRPGLRVHIGKRADRSRRRQK